MLAHCFRFLLWQDRTWEITHLSDIMIWFSTFIVSEEKFTVTFVITSLYITHVLSLYAVQIFPLPLDLSDIQLFSLSVMSDSLWPHKPQHARPPCPSPTPGVYPNSFPLSWWCHPTIASSVIPFSSWPQSFPASGSFQISQLFVSGGQSIGVSASTSVLPMNTQDWFPLERLVGSPCSTRTLNSLRQPTVQKDRFFSAQLSL